MREDYPGQKLSIYISMNDTYDGIALHELLLEFAFNSKLSGGMVTIGDQGFLAGPDESMKLKIFRSAKNPPVLLEFQGSEERIERYLERISPFTKRGLVSREDVLITKFSSEDDDVEDEANEDQQQMFEEKVEVKPAPEMPPPPPPRPEPKPEPPPEPAPTPEPKAEPEPVAEPEPEVFKPADARPEFITPENPEFYSDEPAEAEQPPYEEDDDDDLPLLQLSDESESHPEDFAADDFDTPEPEVVPEEEPQAADSPEPEVAPEEEPQPEDTLESPGPEMAEEPKEEDIDKAFEESVGDFDDSFENMLKKSKKAKEDDTLKQAEGKAESSKGAEGEPDGKDPKTVDKNHTEEDVKNYFSSLFKD